MTNDDSNRREAGPAGPRGAAQQMEAKFAWGRHHTFATCTEQNVVEVTMGWVESPVDNRYPTFLATTCLQSQQWAQQL